MDLEPQESSDLLSLNLKDYSKNEVFSNNGFTPPAHSKRKVPADGGLRAYSVVVGSFLTNGFLFGLINSYSIIKSKLSEINPDASSQLSLAGTLTMGTTFFLSPLSSVLTGFLGLRMTAVLGGTIATVSLILSSFVTSYPGAFCFTYGFLFGLGVSFAYTPSLAILGHYFEKRLGLVNGLVTIGSSVFTIIMPSLMKHLLHNYGIHWMFIILAIFSFGIGLCGFLFKPVPVVLIERPLKEDDGFKAVLKTIVDIKIWRNRKYKAWALSIPVALFGYFVPYVLGREFIEKSFPDVNADIPLQCLGLTSGLGRLMFGYMADKPWVNKISMQQICFYAMGILTIVFPFVNHFSFVLVIWLGLGLCDGGFISLIGPIAIELCGRESAAQAIGCMLGLAAIPLCLGPLLATHLLKVFSSYQLVFIIGGIASLIGATLMFITRINGIVRVPLKTRTVTNGHVTSEIFDVEKPVLLIKANGHSGQAHL